MIDNIWPRPMITGGNDRKGMDGRMEGWKDRRISLKDLFSYYIKKATGRLHHRIRLVHHFEVEPALYSTCPYYTELETAEEYAVYEDEFAAKYLDEDGTPLNWKKERKENAQV